MNPAREINPFGMTKMLEFLQKPNDDVLTAIDRSILNFKQNLSEADCQKDLDKMTTLIQVIGEKLCGDTALPHVQNGVVAVICEDSFLAKLEPFAFKVTYSGTG